MLRVPGPPKDTNAVVTTGAEEPESLTSAPSTTRSRAAREEAAAAKPALIQPTPLAHRRLQYRLVETVPVQTYSTHYPNAPYQPVDPSRQASTTQSTSQQATPTPHAPTTILLTYPAYTGAGYTPSTTTTPLNPLSNLNNHGYRYGGPEFEAGVTGTTASSTTWDFVYDRDVHHDNHFIHADSIPRGY